MAQLSWRPAAGEEQGVSYTRLSVSTSTEYFIVRLE